MTDWREECQSLSDENERLRARIAELEAQLATAVNERNEAQYTVAHLSARNKELESKLAECAELMNQVMDSRGPTFLQPLTAWGDWYRRARLALSSGDAGK